MDELTKGDLHASLGGFVGDRFRGLFDRLDLWCGSFGHVPNKLAHSQGGYELVLDACYQSARNGRIIALDDA